MRRKIANHLAAALMLCLVWLLWPGNVMASSSPEAVKLQSYKDYLKDHASEQDGKSDISVRGKYHQADGFRMADGDSVDHRVRIQERALYFDYAPVFQR